MTAKYYFDVAKKGDEVCFVDEFWRVQQDIVLNVVNSNEPQKKFIHLERSHLVIFNTDKGIIYHKDRAEKLHGVLETIKNNDNDHWRQILPFLMMKESNQPFTPAVPQMPL